MTEARRPPAWMVTAGRKEFLVRAWTRSHARAAAKHELGLGKRSRLPDGTRLVRLDLPKSAGEDQ